MIRSGALALALGLAAIACAPKVPQLASRRELPRPRVNADVSVVLPVFEERVLPSGLTVWYWRRPDAQVVSAGIALRRPRTGDGDQAAALVLAHRLLLDGTGKRTGDELAGAFARLGARPRAWPFEDGALVQATVVPRNLPGALALLAEMVISPLDDAAVIQQRSGGGPGSPGGYQAPASLAAYVLYEELGRLVPAPRAAVTGAQLRRVRAAALDPTQAALILVGDFPVEDTLDEVEALFGAWRRQPEEQPALVPLPPAQAPRFVLVPWPGLRQTHVAVGRRLPGLNAREDVALSVGVGVYAGWLNHFRADSGTSYGSSHRLALDRDGGLLQVQVAVDARVTGALLRDVLGFMRDLRARPISARAAVQSREIFSQAGAVAATDSTGHLYTAAGRFLRGHERGRPNQRARALATLKTEDIKAALVQYLDPTAVTVVVIGDPEVVGEAARAQGVALVVRGGAPAPVPAAP